jgi:hypothetical protein
MYHSPVTSIAVAGDFAGWNVALQAGLRRRMRVRSAETLDCRSYRKTISNQGYGMTFKVPGKVVRTLAGLLWIVVQPGAQPADSDSLEGVNGCADLIILQKLVW